MNWERMWKEAVMTWLKVLTLNFLGGTEENNKKNSANIGGLWTKIWTQDMELYLQDFYMPLHQDV
jgi:hypothetical protein